MDKAPPFAGSNASSVFVMASTAFVLDAAGLCFAMDAGALWISSCSAIFFIEGIGAMELPCSVVLFFS